jgi:predicted membrane chloride channel (bestrophin family)
MNSSLIYRVVALLLVLFAAAFLVVTVLTWKHFFTAPLALSGIITLGLAVAAWLARRA